MSSKKKLIFCYEILSLRYAPFRNDRVEVRYAPFRNDRVEVRYAPFRNDRAGVRYAPFRNDRMESCSRSGDRRRLYLSMVLDCVNSR